MGFLSKFEGKMEDTFEGAADKMFDAPISPVQIAKKAEKQMRREKMVGAGKQYAPTLYTVLVNPDDDHRLFGYYPTLAGETETYLAAKASEQGLVMDGQPLVRFIVDDGLKHGKFDVIAEAVAAPIIAQLRAEEMQRYGLASPYGGAPSGYASSGRPRPYGARPEGNGQPPQYAPPSRPYGGQAGQQMPFNGRQQPYAAPATPNGQVPFGPPDAVPQGAPGQKPPLPYVPENEIDYGTDYGEYTFDSQDFDDSRDGGGNRAPSHGNGQPLAQSAPGYGDGAAVAGGVPAASQTVVFAGGNQGATPVPAQSAVRARLIDTANNQAYDLATARLLIGRESKNDIVVHDINASRTHAELRYEPQGVWVIADLGSTNGTFVNGAEVSTQPLHEGDRITIGITNFMFTQA